MGEGHIQVACAPYPRRVRSRASRRTSAVTPGHGARPAGGAPIRRLAGPALALLGADRRLPPRLGLPAVVCVHNLLHRVPCLWTFHKVHHAIITMDPPSGGVSGLAIAFDPRLDFATRSRRWGG